MKNNLTYICDKKRHLICIPYSIENLHIMAKDLGIDRCFYHYQGRNVHPHYDIPKRRKREIMKKCKIVSSKELLKIILDNGN